MGLALRAVTRAGPTGPERPRGRSPRRDRAGPGEASLRTGERPGEDARRVTPLSRELPPMLEISPRRPETFATEAETPEASGPAAG